MLLFYCGGCSDLWEEVAEVTSSVCYVLQTSLSSNPAPRIGGCPAPLRTKASRPPLGNNASTPLWDVGGVGVRGGGQGSGWLCVRVARSTFSSANAMQMCSDSCTPRASSVCVWVTGGGVSQDRG